MVAHDNTVNVSPQHGIIPNTGMVTQSHIAHHHGPLGNVHLPAHHRLLPQKLFQLFMQLIHGLNLPQTPFASHAKNGCRLVKLSVC
jgi:hypothetical protein